MSINLFGKFQIDEPRPKNNSIEVVEKVAEEITPDIIKWLNGYNDYPTFEEIYKEIYNLLYDAWEWDGFKLSNKLHEKGWDCDSELVEILNDCDMIRYNVHNQMVKSWVKKENLVPQKQIGYVVEFEGHQGEIVKIDTESYRYVVFVEELGHVKEGYGSHGRYVPCEMYDLEKE